MRETEYVHGYTPREGDRLVDQANTLTELLHRDTLFPSGTHVLEAGCGVGAQTVTLAAKNPDVRFTSIDVSGDSLAAARARIESAGITCVSFRQADIFALPFDREFDHIFVCFVLEHLPDPETALTCLLQVLKPGGSFTVIEGDHGSAFFNPDSVYARRAIQCLIDLQADAGGNSLIGRSLYPLLVSAGLSRVSVSPRQVYADASRPDLVEGFTRNTFTAMVAGVAEQALAQGMMTPVDWEKGIADLYRTAVEDGVFCYTFFKAVGFAGR